MNFNQHLAVNPNRISYKPVVKEIRITIELIVEKLSAGEMARFTGSPSVLMDSAINAISKVLQSSGMTYFTSSCSKNLCSPRSLSGRNKFYTVFPINIGRGMYFD